MARKMGARGGGEMKCLGIRVAVWWARERAVGDGGLACLSTGLVRQTMALLGVSKLRRTGPSLLPLLFWVSMPYPLPPDQQDPGGEETLPYGTPRKPSHPGGEMQGTQHEESLGGRESLVCNAPYSSRNETENLRVACD
ncbi:G-protein coupled receptor 54-like [Platysternon megacephalum]|uniref:G-protein coupled receptor 54-like n=1 Tax=Platysternon megacephalum TaxID=55544 RepID=A0A4D9DI71_9SAUR|nr:G-protein coupled receptor 54-like [Platysternon megacephalum]